MVNKKWNGVENGCYFAKTLSIVVKRVITADRYNSFNVTYFYDDLLPTFTLSACVMQHYRYEDIAHNFMIFNLRLPFK